MKTPAATEDNSLLLALLKDALTGNIRTYLIYCINPQGLLDVETPSALDLAQRVRGCATKAQTVRWNPKQTERGIRQGIMELQTIIMSQRDSDVHSIHKLAEMTQNLQVTYTEPSHAGRSRVMLEVWLMIQQMVKNQSWEKKREESEKIKVKIKSCKSSQSNQQMSGGRHGDHNNESTETVKYLQEQLRQEIEEHLREGRGSAEKVQEKVARIQQLKEALRGETLKSGVVPEESQLCLQTEGPQRELLVLSRERRVLVLQMEALRTEAQQAETDLQDQHRRHQTELHCLREESLQVFRVFRQVSEEQRKLSEGRYRSLLLEAVQDAVYLSAQNQQLQADNKQLHKALGEIKDALVVRGDPRADLISQQE
uniref:Uncharacterized protein n=1 Tax=Nothobranchius korthausae TaxID=1143690 RepID=A0A1A8FHM1_9TELE